MTKFFRHLFLPYQKKKLLIQSFFLLSVVRVGLSIIPFRLLDKWLFYYSADLSTEKPNWIVIESVAQSIKKCSRYVPHASCLTQALATRVLLQLRGQDSSLKIGVSKEKKFIAHAWIEIDGRIVIGKLPRHRRFTVLNHSSQAVL